MPHLDEQTKRDLRSSTPPHLRDAREHGEPGLSAGAIYPVALEEIEVAPMRIPDYWPRMYALDVGWKRTACLWCAMDRDTDTWYLYTEHYAGKKLPSTHATAIRARGEWILGVIDPAARGRSQRDGEQLMQDYIENGLKLDKAKNAVEAGIQLVWERLSTGRLKVFSSLQKFKNEYRLYRRDEDGNIVKKNDHLMDCMRYICLNHHRATKPPIPNARTGRLRGGDKRAGY